MEKIRLLGGDKCGEGKGLVLLIVRVLYGFKSAGFSWRSALAAALRKIGLNPTMAYPNVWIREELRPYGYEYYEMLLVMMTVL